MPSAREFAFPRVDWRLFLRLRTVGFAAGLATSTALPLAFSALLDRSQADCFAHFSYALGEVLALAAGIALEDDTATVVAHGLFTLAWLMWVVWTCHLWMSLLMGSSLPHIAAM